MGVSNQLILIWGVTLNYNKIIYLLFWTLSQLFLKHSIIKLLYGIFLAPFSLLL